MNRLKKMHVAAGVLAGTLLLSGMVYAASGIKMIVDGKEIPSGVPIEIKDGTTMVPARSLVEALGAEINWDGSTQTVVVNSKTNLSGNYDTDQSKVVLTDPKQAAQMYAFGLKQRNASIQFATFSESMKKQTAAEFAKLNGVTGGSSPWITKWEVTKQTKVDEQMEKVEIRLETATSAGPDAPIQLTLNVVKQQDNWYVGAVSSDRELPNSGLTAGKGSAAPAFTNREAVLFAAKAAGRYWHMSIGGAGTPEGPIVEFSIAGKGDHYRWMGEELKTKEKLMTFVEEMFTPEKSQQYWDNQTKVGDLAEVNGRLTQPNADGGSQVFWSKATAALVEEGDSFKKFKFDVPIGETEREQYEVRFRYVEGKGWKLDEDVTKIR